MEQPKFKIGEKVLTTVSATAQGFEIAREVPVYVVAIIYKDKTSLYSYQISKCSLDIFEESINRPVFVRDEKDLKKIEGE